MTMNPLNSLAPSTNFLRIVLLLAGTAWGLTIAVSPWQIESGWNPIPLIFWQTLVTTLLLAGWMLVNRRRFPINRKLVVFYTLTALSGTAIPQVLSLASSEHMAVSVRAIIFALIPMISLFFGLLFRIETVNWRRLAGLALGFCAMVIIAGPGAAQGGFDGQGIALIWLLAMLASVALYAFENNWVKLAMPPDMNPFVALMGANLFAVGFLLPVVWVSGEWVGLPLALDGVHARPTAMFWLVTFLHLFAYGSFIFCINKGGPAFAGQVSYVVTASGVLWGVWLFPAQQLTIWIGIALVIVMLGITLVNPHDSNAVQDGEDDKNDKDRKNTDNA